MRRIWIVIATLFLLSGCATVDRTFTENNLDDLGTNIDDIKEKIDLLEKRHPESKQEFESMRNDLTYMNELIEEIYEDVEN